MNTICAIKPEHVDLASVAFSDDPMVLENYLMDESTAMKGQATRVYLPTTEAEAAAVLAHCHATGTPVSISGGGTGLTCSRVPLEGVVLSTERMVAPVTEPDAGEETIGDGKHTVHLNRGQSYAIAPPAIMLQELAALLATEQLLYPPNPTEQTAFLGGTVVCNASGGRTFHYGPTRAWVQAIRVILPCGEVLDLSRGQILSDDERQFVIHLSSGEQLQVQLPSYQAPATKDASGYFVAADRTDLLDLFIGSEGTLGLVTQVQVGIIPLPSDIFSCMAFFSDVESAVAFVKSARQASRDLENPLDALAIEYYDPHALRLLRPDYPRIPENAGAAVYFEQATSQDDEIVLMEWVELLEEHGCMEDFSGFSEKEKAEMVEIRHAVPEFCHRGVRQHGTYKIATDVAVPDEALDAILAAYHDIGEASGVPYVLFGHIGNNHLHWDFIPENKQQLTAAKQAFIDLSRRGVELGGTISAEHGVGKKSYEENGASYPYLYMMYGEQGLRETALTKHQLDPMHILNRGNIVPADFLDSLQRDSG